MGDVASEEESQQHTSDDVLIMYQQLINRDFDDKMSMIAATKHPNDLQRAVNFILDSSSISDQYVDDAETASSLQEECLDIQRCPHIFHS